MADRKNNETTSWNADEVRRQQTQRKQRKKMRRARFWAIYCAGVVLGSCLLAGLGWLMVNDVCALNKAPLTATVEIEKGDVFVIATGEEHNIRPVCKESDFKIVNVVCSHELFADIEFPAPNQVFSRPELRYEAQFALIEQEFHILHELFSELKAIYFIGNDNFAVLSMGMSHDYPVAIRQGSTMIRVGTSIFGEREY